MFCLFDIMIMPTIIMGVPPFSSHAKTPPHHRHWVESWCHLTSRYDYPMVWN